MATPRDPSRVREAKPYGPALDRSLAVAKTSTRLNKANGLKSLARKGTFLLGYQGGHFYWATTYSEIEPCQVLNRHLQLTLHHRGILPHGASILDIAEIREKMNRLYGFVSKVASDERAQDLVEYALLAGFVAVAAGATLPRVANSISVIFSKMTSVVSNVATL